MNTKDLKARKHKLEVDIRTAIVNLLDAFQDETGISTESIYVELVETRHIGDRESRYLVSDVNLKLVI